MATAAPRLADVHGQVDRIEVRRIAPGDERRLREIRIEALEDAPLAFITTAEEARAHPDDLWHRRVLAGSSGTDQATFLACAGEATVGMAIGLDRSDRAPGVVAVVSVFVSSSARRRGVGDALMSAVESWAMAIGATTTSLWVVDDNASARAFYENRGYRPTLDRQRITAPPQRWETRMYRTLTD